MNSKISAAVLQIGFAGRSLRVGFTGLGLRVGLAALGVVGFGLALVPVGTAHAQQCGDVTGDGNLAASDALAVLKAAVGQPVDLVCEGSCDVLEPRLAAMEALLSHVSVEGNNLRITGQNLQVVSGAGNTYSDTNGTGNVIIGYNEADQLEIRSGSHNLVVGGRHSYTAKGGVVFGVNSVISGDATSILGGTDHDASGDFSTITGGFRNDAPGESVTITGGEDNRADGLSTVIGGGFQNETSGFAGTLSGGRERELTDDYGWRGGGLTQEE